LSIREREKTTIKPVRSLVGAHTGAPLLSIREQSTADTGIAKRQGIEF
jgi:hypothetical protein